MNAPPTPSQAPSEELVGAGLSVAERAVADPSAAQSVEELRAQLAEQQATLRLLQDELDETNRGVVALYAELDEQAEQLRLAKRVSDTKFLAIYERAPTGIALLDADGRIVEVNPAMVTMLGRPMDALAGMHLRDLSGPEWGEVWEQLSQPRRGSISRQQIPIAALDGAVVHLEWSITPLAETGLTLALASDVSGRVDLERLRVQWLERERVARSDAEHASRLKDDFIAVLAHELHSPLNAISGWAQVLKRKAPPELERAVESIARNCVTQARMISDLLDMSRLRLGKLAMTFASVDPVAEVNDALQALQPSIDEQQLAFTLVTQDAPERIQADASRLQQIVWNLVTNAIKFTPRGGSVALTLAQEGDMLRLCVRDSGQGMSAEFLPRVFDRFTQGDAASNVAKGGLGLGLAIIKQIVEAHAGRISVTSPGVGQGTTFTVELPVVQERRERDEDLDDGEAASAPLAGLEVLVVDDNEEASTVLAVVLSDRGASVRASSDAEAALHLVRARRPDVLISDIGMPGKDGYALIREIRLSDAARGVSRLPAIALTAFARDEDRLQALEAGFDAHCAKPLRPLELVRQVVLLARKG